MSTEQGGDPTGDPAARFAAVAHDADRRRARDLRVYGPPRRRTDLIWLGIAVAGAVIFVALILAILDRSKWTAGRSAWRDAATGRGHA